MAAGKEKCPSSASKFEVRGLGVLVVGLLVEGELGSRVFVFLCFVRGFWAFGLVYGRTDFKILHCPGY